MTVYPLTLLLKLIITLLWTKQTILNFIKISIPSSMGCSPLWVLANYQASFTGNQILRQEFRLLVSSGKIEESMKRSQSILFAIYLLLSKKMIYLDQLGPTVHLLILQNQRITSMVYGIPITIFRLILKTNPKSQAILYPVLTTGKNPGQRHQTIFIKAQLYKSRN